MPRLFTLFQANLTLQYQQQRKKVYLQFQSTSYFSTTRQQKVHQQDYTQSRSNFGQNQYHYYENVVTENTILSAFPRPNLTPTLHHTLFSNPSLNANGNNQQQQKNKIKCKHCNGPHSSNICPC
ncbi:unnamed protein product [Cunninghamella echinulata]